MEKNKRYIWPIFLITEFILYIFILFSSGTLLAVTSFSAIVLCFLYSLMNINKENGFINIALFNTVLADFCLVVMNPINRTLGMIFFVIVQTLYSIKLLKKSKSLLFLGLRIGLILIIECLTFVILKDKIDLLAIISVMYYALLIINIVESFMNFKEDKLFSIGLVLFIMCDTIIGLQTLDSMYIRLGEDNIIYKILYCGFNLSWLFYLPSQVLISLSTYRRIENEI